MHEHVDGLRSIARPAAVRLRSVVAILAGVLTGGFAAWAYYNDPFRPMAHTFGLWILTVALLSARRSRRSAVVASCLALLAAVVAFYVGKKVIYGVRYPGMPYPLNLGEFVEWGVLAVVAGPLLGAVFAGIGAASRRGAIATAAAVGLLVADAYRRSGNHPADGQVVIGFALLAVAVVLAVAARSPRQLLAIAVWTVPAAVIGSGLVAAPDALEQLLITGSL